MSKSILVSIIITLIEIVCCLYISLMIIGEIGFKSTPIFYLLFCLCIDVLNSEETGVGEK